MSGIGLGMLEVIIPQKSDISMKQILRGFRMVAAVISYVRLIALSFSPGRRWPQPLWLTVSII